MTASIINLDNAATSRGATTFNSACTAHDGNTYLLTSAGLVQIDPTATADAEVTFGLQDFGKETFKLVPTAYMGISAAKRMAMDVIVEDMTYIYFIRDFGNTLQQQRFDFGRGLRANWYKFRLYNTEGCDFTLADFTLMPLASKRRI